MPMNRRASTGGGISPCVHSWDRHTVQEFVDSHRNTCQFLEEYG
jgi:hypothetical protein